MVYTEKIGGNISFSWADFRYKRERLVIELNCQLDRDTMTGISLLSYILSSATAKYDNLVSLSRYLDNLYGASLYVSSSRYGNKMIIHFDTDNVAGEYLTEKDIGIRTAELLCDVITNPYLIGRGFPDSTIEIEKEKLREEISFLINNKEAYCTRMLLQRFFAGSVRSLPDLGFVEDLPSINGENLYSLYLDCLKNCNINIFYCGSDLKRVRDIVANTIGTHGLGSVPQTFDSSPVRLPKEPVNGEEAIGTEQDIFSIVYHTGRIPDPAELASLKVANSILGGMSTSRLFMNVRERQGLCYSCVSNRMTSGGGGILIESSTSPEKFVRNRDSIMEEFGALASEGPSEEELRQAKLSISNSLRGISDTVAGVSSHYLSSINGVGRYIEPERELSLIESVSAEDVKGILSEMRYCGIYRLHDE